MLRVHPSNFAQTGFVEAPDPVEVARVAHEHGAIVVDDLGSGALLDTARYGLAHEPMPRERLAAGADLVTFSGDKLVGGPQAGLIVGRADLIARIRRDPLARAVRPEKVTLAALAATLGLVSGRAGDDRDPRLADDRGDRRRAARSRRGRPRGDAGAMPDRVEIASMTSAVGGGSLPGETLESVGLRIVGQPAGGARRAASRRRPARHRRGSRRAPSWLDLRTIDPAEDAALAGAIVRAIGAARTG